MKYSNKETGTLIEAFYCGCKENTYRLKHWLKAQGIELKHNKSEGEPYYFTDTNSDLNLTISNTALIINGYPTALDEVYLISVNGKLEYHRKGRFEGLYELAYKKHTTDRFVVDYGEEGVIVQDYNGAVTYISTTKPEEEFLKFISTPEDDLYNVLKGYDSLQFNVQDPNTIVQGVMKLLFKDQH